MTAHNSRRHPRNICKYFDCNGLLYYKRDTYIVLEVYSRAPAEKRGDSLLALVLILFHPLLIPFLLKNSNRTPHVGNNIPHILQIGLVPLRHYTFKTIKSFYQCINPSFHRFMLVICKMHALLVKDGSVLH